MQRASALIFTLALVLSAFVPLVAPTPLLDHPLDHVLDHPRTG